MKIVTAISSASASETATLPPVGERLPTGSTAIVNDGSTTSGVVQPRTHEASFGLKVLDLVGDIAGEGVPRLSPRAREHAAVLIDAGMEQALKAAREASAANTAATRWVIRALGAGIVALAFAVIGVLLWSLGARLDKVEVSSADTQDKIEAVIGRNADAVSEAEEHRAKIDENVKLLAAHAVALTDAVNQTSKANYELLSAIVDKVGARSHVPKLHEPPVEIEVPVTLRVVAGER